jgi:hypothetical protein
MPIIPQGGLQLGRFVAQKQGLSAFSVGGINNNQRIINIY